MDTLRDTFEQHYRRWKAHAEDDALALSSSDVAYTDNPPFRAMVEMGWPAVPYLIEKLRTDDGNHFLIHALAEITGHRITLEEARAAQGDPGAVPGNQAYVACWLAWWDAHPKNPDAGAQGTQESGRQP